MPAARATITFLSDYGLADPFVGVCHAVMAGIAPHVRVIDVSHGIPPQDVVGGALTLADCAAYLPRGVHLAVVDPGVGTARRAVAVSAGEHLLVGPDNGLLVPAAERLGGIDGAWELADPRYQLDPVSATFHGRDVFAPAAAHLASGVAPDQLGPARRPGELARVDLPTARLDDGRIEDQVVLVDGFGNASLSVGGDQLAAAGLHAGDTVSVGVGERSVTATVSATFAAVPAGELAVLVDSFGRAALAVNGGNAARTLDARPGSTVTLSRAHQADAPPGRETP